MFERRLKVLLAILCGLVALLLLRSLQVQVIDGAYWEKRAAETMSRPLLLETARGSLRDVQGRVLASDEPCIEAAVDYRAIVRDGQWMQEQAMRRILRQRGAAYRAADRAGRRQMLSQELSRLEADLERMWEMLAAESGKGREHIEQVKADIMQRVAMRQRYVWYKRYEAALREHNSREPLPWYREWFVYGRSAPQIDSFATIVGEQVEPHVILPAIDNDTHNRLKKRLEEFPGLVVRPSKHRVYAADIEAACHLIGRLGIVNEQDLQSQVNADDDLRHYLRNDLIGRGGLEQLCEPLLRGRRGRLVRQADREDRVEAEPQPGMDVRATIDLHLHKEILAALRKEILVADREDHPPTRRANLHGAAVVIDVPTGEVRALVSNPTFDPNRWEQMYETWLCDDLNQPLLNRATMAQHVPGSLVKTIIALGGISDGTIAATSTIECTGFLELEGHGRFEHSFRCWTARVQGGPVRHHAVPLQDPHPTGFLTASDALQRSCNVFFETLAWRMGLERVHAWFGHLGLGRKTGIGIAEVPGMIPDPSRVDPSQRLGVTLLAGVGQGRITVTPLQMANVAATIARDGVWIRPRLIPADLEARMGGTNGTRRDAMPDRIDLKLPPVGITPEALQAVRDGMYRSANTVAGTGSDVHVEGIKVAAKTGSAQASPLRLPMRTPDNQLMRDDKGRLLYRDQPVQVDTLEWYQGTGKNRSLAHAWYIGYAPADHPQIAFAVLVEYGGAGGAVAGAVASDVLEACVRHGYLTPAGGKP